MTAKVILNPYSHRWNSKARWPEAEAALKSAGVDFELAVSDKKGGITALVEQAARDGFSPIIAAGGDGTIGEAVNGMVRAAGSLEKPIGPFGIMPLGSANRSIGRGVVFQYRADERVQSQGARAWRGICDG